MSPSPGDLAFPALRVAEETGSVDDIDHIVKLLPERIDTEFPTLQRSVVHADGPLLGRHRLQGSGHWYPQVARRSNLRRCDLVNILVHH